jgi:hypothetical protein
MNLDSINLEKLTDEEFKILERRIEDERKRRDKEIHDKKQKMSKNYSSIFTKLYILFYNKEVFTIDSDLSFIDDEELKQLLRTIIDRMIEFRDNNKTFYDNGRFGSFRNTNFNMFHFHTNEELRILLDKLNEYVNQKISKSNNSTQSLLKYIENKLIRPTKLVPTKLVEKIDEDTNPTPKKPTISDRFSSLAGSFQNPFSRRGGSNKKYKRCKTKRKY